MGIRILLMLLTVITATVLVHAQQAVPVSNPVGGWIHNMYGGTSPQKQYSMTWRYDAHRKLIAIRLAQYVFVSTDSGKRFRAVDIPVKRTVYGDMEYNVTDSSSMYITSRDLINDSFDWTLRSTDKGVTWDSVRWKGLFLNPGKVEYALGPLLTYKAFPPGGQSLFWYISTDRGKTWKDSLQSAGAEAPWHGLDTISPSQLCFITSSGPVAVSWLDGSRKDFGPAVFPPNTIMVHRFNAKEYLIQQHYQSKWVDSTFLLRSIDSGRTWTRIKSLKFSNRDTTIPFSRSYLLTPDGSRSATFWMDIPGHVYATSDAGETWFLRGRLPADYRAPSVSEFTVYPERHVLIQTGTTNNGRLAFLTIGSSDSIEYRPSPAGMPLQVSDSIFLIAAGTGIYRSTDAGLSWFLLDDSHFTGYSGQMLSEDPNVQPYQSRALWWGYDDRLWQYAVWEHISDRVGTQRVRRTDEVLSLTHPSTAERRWFNRGVDKLDTVDAFRGVSESNLLQPQDRMPSSIRIRIDPSIYRGGRFSVAVKVDSGSPARTTVRRAVQTAFETRDGKIVLWADSLLVSSDTAWTWRVVPTTGLPLTSTGTLPLITSFTEGINGEWYVGLSARIILDTALNETREVGGIYTSTDFGVTWSVRPTNPQFSHVTNLQTDGSGRLFALATERTIDPQRADYLQGADYCAVLYEIRPDSAVEIKREVFSGPVYWAPRALRRDHLGAILFGSVKEGLLRTEDAGETWQRIAPDTLESKRFYEIVVDRQNRYYLGTDRGVYMVDALSTSVRPGDAPRRPNALRVTPNPASSVLNVSFDNPQNFAADRLSLSIVDLQGRPVKRISPLPSRTVDTATHEVDIDVSGLPNGVYCMVLNSPDLASPKLFVIAR
jgi:photosystem II stability/assembly factor-like uncharacterized protein